MIALSVIVLGGILFASLKNRNSRHKPEEASPSAALSAAADQLALRSTAGNGTNSVPKAESAPRDGQQPTASDSGTAAVELNAKGNGLLKAGDVDGAIQCYRQALALTADDEDLHYNLGLAYARRGDLTNAEAAYRHALRLLPDFPEAHNNLGKLLFRAGKLTEAEHEFNEALELMPEYAQAHNNLGILQQRLNRSEEALQSFQKAIQYETNYLEAHFNLAGVYVQRRNLPRAIAELRETLRINPQFKVAQQLLAQMTNAPAAVPGDR